MSFPNEIGPDEVIRLEAADWSEMAVMVQRLRDAGALPPRGMPAGARYVMSDDPQDHRAVVLLPLHPLRPRSSRALH